MTLTESPESLLAEASSRSHESEFFNPLPKGYVKGRHKFVVVLGTVMSGLGKGIFSSSLAKLLKDKGLKVAPLKMEGYLNIDSGTLNPYRHGEVFVLDDGMETDMDLGTYERMLEQDLSRDSYTTSGQVFRKVLDKERHGGYLGRDVQMIPHVTGEVKYQLRELAQREKTDVVFIEVGGTVGDYENGFYIEALRQLAFEEGESSVCFVALTYVIEPEALGEQKSKAAQLGLRKLMEAGIQPYSIAVRSHNAITESTREKIAMFSNVPMERVFSMHDRDTIYTIPEAIRRDGIDRAVLTKLDLHGRVDQAAEDASREEWQGFVRSLTGSKRHGVTLGITGKYAALRDAYASIDKALEHCSAHLSTKIDMQWIDTTKMRPDDARDLVASLDAVIVPGGFGQRGTDAKIACVRACREMGVPYLGICLGFQMAVIEFARNVCGLGDADSTEFDPHTPTPLISILPEQKQIEGLGGNMRLGGKDVLIEGGTLAAFLFKSAQGAKGHRGQGEAIDRINQPALHSAPGPLGPSAPGFTTRQRFRHRYEVDPRYIETLTRGGLVFSGRHPDQPIMQVLELPVGDVSEPGHHPYFIGGQFHPELLSRPLHPHPMFMGLIAAAVAHGEGVMGRGVGDEAVEAWVMPPSSAPSGDAEPGASAANAETMVAVA